MRQKQGIYKCIAAALLAGMMALGAGLTPGTPEDLTGPAQTIRPETDSSAPATQPPETQPPETEPPATQPPETQPPETQPPETEPPKTEPPETEPPATQPPVQPTTPKPDNSPGGNGDTDEDGKGETVPAEGPEDDSQLQIVTDLFNGEITYAQLVNDTFRFYAYLLRGGERYLRLKLRNSATPANGRYLTADDGKNYEAVLCRNEANYITLYAKFGNETELEVTYVLRYVAQKADRDNPTVGENPPTIVTNLTGVEQLSNRNFTLTVRATAYAGKALTAGNIEVRLDGALVKNPTGGPVYEYQLYFPNPSEGDVDGHNVTVRAWDEEGNSAFYSYSFDYHFVDTGGEIGTAYIILDATTVGLGVMEEPYTYRIRQGVPASYAILEMLTEYGYEFDYAGTPDVGFYLRRISRGGLMDYAEIPQNLWNKVLQDGLTLTGQTDTDSLGEFDYTQGSGWMYSIGGEIYAGKGLSGYYLSNGDTLYLRFTLAYGKDIGGYVTTGGTFGNLPSYCGLWINDSYIDQHLWGEETVTREPTCTQPGQKSRVCALCGDQTDTVPIPALEHDWEQAERVEPTQGTDGYILRRCTHCRTERKELLPWIKEQTG